MRCLVTGGAGFIGSHLVDMLLGLGHQVRVFDDLSTGRMASLPKPGLRWELIHGSVTRQADVERAFELFAPQVVFHLAAQIDVRTSMGWPVEDADTNVMGTVRMLEAAVRHGVGRFVFASSAATFGDQVVGDEHPRHWAAMRPRPISPYGASKAAAELYVQLYDRQGIDGLHNLCTTTVVFPNVYGPRQRTGAVALFTRALLAGEPVTLYGDGGNTRDYLFVTEAARALCWAAGVLTPGTGMGNRGRTLVGTGVGTTDAELLNLVSREVLAQAGPIVLADDEQPPPVRWAPARPGDIRTMVFPADNGMARTTLADGLTVTVQEIRKEMGL